jgi:vacuolar-type H+-ATPase subunit I/STV1
LRVLALYSFLIDREPSCGSFAGSITRKRVPNSLPLEAHFLFLAVIIGSILLIFGIAFSLYWKVLWHTAMPMQLPFGAWEPFWDTMLLIIFLAYAITVIFWPSPIIRVVEKAESLPARLKDP